MSSAVVSETEPSSSSTRGLSRVLGKTRRKKNKQTSDDGRRQSTVSAISGISTEEGSEGPRSIRSSIDSARARVSQAVGKERDPEAKSTLDPTRLKDVLSRKRSKRRKKLAGGEDAQGGQDAEAERGRSIAERGTLENDADSSKSRSHSRPSKLAGRSESSFVTYDSDNEKLASPPTLVSHQSHLGYLTFTSPLIDTQSTTPNPPQDTTATIERTQTAPTDSTASSPPAPPRYAFTLQTPEDSPRSIVTEQAREKTINPSPVGRLKGALKGQSSRRSPSPNPSLDRDSVKSASSGPGGKLGGLFGRKQDDRGSGSRRSSSASRPLAKFTDQTPPVPPVGYRDEVSDVPSSTTSIGQAKRIDSAPRTPLDTAGTAGAPVASFSPPTPTDPRRSPSISPGSPSSSARKPNISRGDATDDDRDQPSSRVGSHRQTKSASAVHNPSKLANAISAPLTPAAEEARSKAAPSLSSTGPSQQSGFFSSVISAAQNAATTLSTSINTSLGPGVRASGNSLNSQDQAAALHTDATVTDDFTSEEGSTKLSTSERELRRPLAVETLGSGDLDLSHLGIAVEPQSSFTSAAMAETNPSPGQAPRPASANSGGPEKATTAAQIDRSNTGGTKSLVDGVREGLQKSTSHANSINSVSLSNGDRPSYSTITPVVEDVVPAKFENNANGDHSPPSTQDWDRESGIGRSGSVRSGRSRTGMRRKRGSSATTGNTIAAAIGATNATLANPSIQSSTPRLTGFAVASKKRNKDFHNLFKSVPEDDYLIEDYSAAIQKDILLHGRIYISEGHICFYSNIFGYVTTLVISFDEVVSVEKKSTAILFPNAIVINTLHAKNIFASLASRDTTYDLLIGIWKISHPNLMSSLNGVKLDQAGGGDKTVKAEDSGSDDSDEDEDEDDEEEVYDEDEEEEGLGSFVEGGEGSVTVSDAGDGAVKPISRKPSAMVPTSNGNSTTTQGNGDSKSGTATGSSAAPDFPGPASHAPTQCTDQDTHYDKVIKDEVIPAPLGKIYTLMFGPASGAFMTRWLRDEQKVLELQLEDDKKGLGEDKRTRASSYIKPLTGSMGPKQTQCNITENLDFFDLEKAVSVTVTTQTPDVPSGNVFSVKTKYCLMWAEGNSTRLIMNCTIVWTGKSWLKTPIEKGANDGQVTYANDIVAALKVAVKARSPTVAGSKGRKRRKRDPLEAGKVSDGSRLGGESKKNSRLQGAESWGLLEPLRGPLGPLVDIIRPLLSTNVALVFISLLLAFTWTRQYLYPSPYPHTARAGNYVQRPSGRRAALEEVWRQEEAALWDWLEERVGIDGISTAALRTDNEEAGAGRKKVTALRSAAGQTIEAKLAQEKMNEREVDEAIRVTQERLDVLKSMIDRQKGAKQRDGDDAVDDAR
ncbi:MAG: hypothetical protein M1825_001326 [Sarcosagium campestre]|nr:MAG: hypothetical protein M1825_001326 [Sarcosagium campestre]